MIRFKRPLPLIVCGARGVHDLHVEFDEATQQWNVAATKVGDGFVGWITVGKSTCNELALALTNGIEISPAADAEFVAVELVNQGRAEFVNAA